MLSSFSNDLCFSSGQRSCVGTFVTEHNSPPLKNNNNKFSAKKEIKTVEHRCIYKGLLRATCFGFREKPYQANKNYTKRDIIKYKS